MKSKPPKESFKFDFLKERDRFGEWLGYQVSKMIPEEKSAITTLVIREDHLSATGRVHGGAIAGYLDFALGAAVFATMGPKDICSTVELKVNYLKPLNLGDLLRVEAKAVFQGKRLCVVTGFMYRNEEKDPVSMASGTYNVIRNQVRKDAKNS